MSIRKNKKTNKWEFDYKDLRGKRQTKKGFKTKAEAQIALNKMVEDLNKGLNPVNAKITLKEAGELYLRLHASSNCKPSTYKTYCGYLQNLLVPFFGELNINEINPILIKEFIKQMQDKGRQNSTINKYVKFISAIYNFMIDSDAATRNPVARIKPLKEIKNDKIRALSTQEVQALLSKTKVVYPDFYPVLFTALFTGMRRGELLALTWDSINWVKGKITVDKNYVNGRLGTPKSSKARYVDMSDELTRVLKQWRLACPCGELNLVFPNNEGKYQSADNMIKRRFNKVLDGAGVARVRFHDLRHTYASLLLAKDMNIKYIQKQMGHASFEITMNTYAHLMPEVYEKSEKAINNLL